MRWLYLLLAFGLMGSGGYLLSKDKEVGAALVAAGVSALTIQQVEEHKEKERRSERRSEWRSERRSEYEEIRAMEKDQLFLQYKLNQFEYQLNQFQVENNTLNKKVEEKDVEISELKSDKAVLETRLE